MLNILQSIITTITALVNYVAGVLGGILVLISHIPTYISFLSTGIGFLPMIIVPFATVYISLYAVKFILGREN